MDIVSAILLFGAALAGLFLLVHVSGNMKRPTSLVLTHVTLAGLGFLALVIYAFTTEQPEKHYYTLAMLAIAGIVGLWLLFSGGSVYRLKALAITYSLLGMFALFWLLTFVVIY